MMEGARRYRRPHPSVGCHFFKAGYSWGGGDIVIIIIITIMVIIGGFRNPEFGIAIAVTGLFTV